MSSTRLNDEYYMRLALRLAKKGAGRVSPNPMVGAVVVDPSGNVVSTGYHPKFGELHAERIALEKLEYNAHGSTLYVNLEPCCHYGKTPPCTEAIIKSGIKRVVIGVLDPNPKVAGKGVEILKKHGIEVKVGVLEEECRWLNRGFFKWVAKGIPYVVLKWAQTIDGKIATVTGDSKWISSEKALDYAHRLRAESDAVLVGKTTVFRDDPMLTVRRVKGISPTRVVLDSKLDLPIQRKIFDVPPKTVVFTVSDNCEKIETLRRKGVEVITVSRDEKGKVNLTDVLKKLGEMGITKLLVEGGALVHGTFIKKGLVDEFQIIISPKIFGSGVNCVCGIEAQMVSEAYVLKFIKVKKLGEDVLIVAKPMENRERNSLSFG